MGNKYAKEKRESTMSALQKFKQMYEKNTSKLQNKKNKNIGR